MSVGEAKATIRRGIQSADEGRKIIEAVAADTLNTARATLPIVHDSRQSEIEKGLGCLKAAAHELDLTVRLLKGSIESANEYLSALG